MPLLIKYFIIGAFVLGVIVGRYDKPHQTPLNRW